MIHVLPGTSVRVDASLLLAVTGAEPARAIVWSADFGTVTAFSDITDATGRAFARYTPSSEGPAVITATYGA